MRTMWNERYNRDDFAYGTQPNDFLHSVAGQISGNKVLCLAEGEGRNAVWLAEQGFDVTAVDSSAVGLAKAQQLARSRGVSITTEVVDLADYDMGSAQWDAIIAIYCHLPPALRQVVHRQVFSGLRPAGAFVLEAFTPAQIGRGTGGPGQPDMMMTLAELKRELAGLDIIQGRELVREVIEGRFHTGEAAVVQLLATKP